MPVCANQHAPALSDEYFRLLAEIVRKKTGLVLPGGARSELESRLGLRAVELGLSGLEQYLRFVTVGPQGATELEELLDIVCPTRPAFFSQPEQLAYFVQAVIPTLMESRRESAHLRIWSAGCGAGHEPYSIAAALLQGLGNRLNDWRIEILGTDVSGRQLAIAAEGVYGPESFESAGPPIGTRWFLRDGSRWKVAPAIRSIVSFEQHNLMDRLGAKRLGTWDVILCRGLLGALHADACGRVLSTLVEQLADGGFLFIGSNEKLDPPPEGLSEPDSAGTHCYQKRTGRAPDA